MPDLDDLDDCVVGAPIYDDVAEPAEVLCVTLSMDTLGGVTRFVDLPGTGLVEEEDLAPAQRVALLQAVAAVIQRAATDLAVDLVRLGVVGEIGGEEDEEG